MKFIFLIIFMIMFSFFTSRKIKEVHPKDKENLVYQFNLGFVETVKGDVSFLDECTKTVPKWNEVGLAEEKSRSLLRCFTDELLQSLNRIDKMLVADNIDPVCNFREEIISQLVKDSKRNKVKRRAPAQATNVSGKWWHKIQPKVDGYAKAVVKGMEMVGDTVIKTGKWLHKKPEDLYKFVKDKLSTTFQPILNDLAGIKHHLHCFFEKNKFMEVIMKFLQCYYLNNKINSMKIFMTAVQNLLYLSKKLGKPEGWIDFQINVICGWISLKKAIKFLSKSMKEKDISQKYLTIGKFLGSVFEAFAS